MADLLYGIVPLPDGRQCKCYVKGVNHPNSWDESGYFETNEDSPLEIDHIDGVHPHEREYEKEYTVGGEAISLGEFCIDWLIKYGTFEAWEPDYD